MHSSKSLKVTLALLVGVLLFGIAPRQDLKASGTSQSYSQLNATAISAPATGSQATVTVAAAANNRHVADCISFSSVSLTAPVQTFMNVVLRDGATGAGTVIWQHSMVIQATASTNYPSFSYCGLNRSGSTNTAMTLEFSTALANLTEVVNLAYHDVAP